MPAGTAVKMIVFSAAELSVRPHCAESIQHQRRQAVDLRP